MSNVAVVLAGGSGDRLKLEFPKQFAKVAGKQIIEHTVEIFQGHPRIDHIVIVSRPEYNQHVLELVNGNHYTKVIRVINGGATRADSTRAAIRALDELGEDTNVLFHDAVRPFLAHSIIDRCLDALKESSAVDVVVESADTLVVVDQDGFVADIPDRARLRRGQTPQGFKLGIIRKAYELFDPAAGVPVTCDAGVVLRSLPGVRISTVEGETANIKVTDPIDMFLADKMFQSRGDTAINHRSHGDIDAGMRDKVMVIFGGSSGIGQEIGRQALRSGAVIQAFSRHATGTDVSKPSDILAAVQRVVDQEGRVDFVVNTAALLVRRPLMHMSDDEVADSIATNLRGSFTIAKAVYPHLARTAGSLLLFTSSSYTRGRAFMSVYSATKAGVVNMAQALAEEWQSDGIRVNCLNPERTATPMRSRNFGVESAGTLLSVDRVAEAALAVLISPASGLVVDVRISDAADMHAPDAVGALATWIPPIP